MCAWIESIDPGPVYKYFSRWSFERLLDRVAQELAARLRRHYPCELGCSILYRVKGNENKYVLGGSSRRRTLMDPTARYYNTSRAAAATSLTAHALFCARPLGYDDFRKRDSSGAEHTAKSCELDPGLTESYLAIPRLPRGERRRKLLRELADAGQSVIDKNFDEAKERPSCLLRLSFATKGYAVPTLRAFLTTGGEELLEKIFTLVETGMAAMQREGAMAIADLNSNLLCFHSEEYKGLDELAFHLQTLFDGCECSIFLAHPMSKLDSRREVRLYLAATSALSNHWPQHKEFRAKFFEQSEYYSCIFERGGGPRAMARHKTERAYCEPDAPQLFVTQDTMPKGKFSGKGEFPVSTSFLAVAIPPPVQVDPPNAGGQAEGEPAFPYGVIRLVRGKGTEGADTPEPFTEANSDLAAAIARTLRYWLDFFPRNHELEIRWASHGLKVNTLRSLFAIDQTVPHAPEDEENQKRADQNNEIEFDQLLRKVFCKSNLITIKKQFAGHSGAVVLLVENASGLDLILKVAIKGEPHLEQQNLIVQEVVNYREFVEGKLALNHNVIYPELIRETRRINGFATSFLGSGHRDRLTLRDYIARGDSPTVVFTTIGRVVERIVQEVWGFWYRGDQQRREGKKDSVERYLLDGLCVPDWYVLTDDGANVAALDSPVRDACACHSIKSHELPSALWRVFKKWRIRQTVEWSEAVTHGDLHSGNIFLDPVAMDVWVIDFARTGWRTAIFDLALLENNVKLHVLSTVLNLRNSVEDYRAFLAEFYQMEFSLAQQSSYGNVPLPRLSDRSLAGGVHEAMLGAMKVVSQIRLLLHQVIGRRGSTLDYRLALYALAHRYMGVRGASDEDTSSLQILMAYESVQAQLNAMIPTRAKRKSR